MDFGSGEAVVASLSLHDVYLMGRIVGRLSCMKVYVGW